MNDQDPGCAALPANDVSGGRKEAARTSRRFNRTSALSAFVIWGGWAYFVNARPSRNTSAPPLISGLIQGTASCLITLVMLRAVTCLYHRLSACPLRLVLPALITTAVTGSGVTVVHVLAGTSNIPATIAPGMIVAFCFNIFTAYKLRQTERRML